MSRRQTSRWLLITEDNRVSAVALARRLARGSGVLLLADLEAAAMRRLRQVAASRDLTVVREARGAAMRVHDLAQLRAALGSRTPLILLSPIYPTRTHPDWKALPRMRAAAFARLGGRKLVALGGMNDRRYAAVRDLGFVGWAGMSAFRT